MVRVLLTRPLEAAKETAAELAEAGVEAALWPLTKIAFAPMPDTTFRRVGAYAFTSAHGVKAARRAAAPNRPAFCVGPKTAEAARAAGFDPVLDADGDGAALVQLCLEHIRDIDGLLLHIRGEEARVDLGAEIGEAGWAARSVIAYRAAPTGPPPPHILDEILQGRYSIYAFYSPRAAVIFAECAESAWDAGLARGAALAISEAAAAPLSGLGFGALRIAQRPNGAAMRAALCGAAT